MINKIFIHLASASMRQNYIRLEGKLGEDYIIGKDYSYIQASKIAGKKKKLEAGTSVTLLPTIKVNPHQCRLLIVPSAELALAGNLSYQSIIEPVDKPEIAINLQVLEDINLNDISWLCRIYALD